MKILRSANCLITKYGYTCFSPTKIVQTNNFNFYNFIIYYTLTNIINTVIDNIGEKITLNSTHISYLY